MTRSDADRSDPRDAPRLGEATLAQTLADDARLCFIGTIETPFSKRDQCPKQGDPQDGPICRLHVAPAFVPALAGLTALPRLEVFYWLHASRRDVLTQGSKQGRATTGAFALRSPARPNPIGVSEVSVLSVEGAVLTVRGLDCVSGTPLLDIKPVRCAYGGARDTRAPT